MIPGKIVPAFVKPAGDMPRPTAGRLAFGSPPVEDVPCGTGRVPGQQQTGPSLQPTGAGASQPARTPGSVLGKRQRDDGPAPFVFDAKHASSEPADIEEILRQMVEEVEAPITPAQLESLSGQPIDLSWLEEPAPRSPVEVPRQLVLDVRAEVVWVHGVASKIPSLQSRILAMLLQDKGTALTGAELAQKLDVKVYEAANACRGLFETCGKDNFCNAPGLGYYVPLTVTGGVAEETAVLTPPVSPSSSTYCTGDKRMVLDLESLTVRVADKPDPVQLTATQCALVRALLQKKGGVLSKEELGKALDVRHTTVPYLVTQVRKACGKNSILTIYGEGYYILDWQTRVPR